jgi:hypothetical protein
MKANKSLRFVITVVVLLISSKLANAQSQSVQTADQLGNEVAASTEKYKASLEALISIEENNVKDATETQARRQRLFAEGVVSKREVEESEQALVVAQAKLDEVRKQFTEADQLKNKVEVKSKVEAPKAVAQARPFNVPIKVVKSYGSIATMIRYDGPTQWSLADLGEVQAFFTKTFGRSLPTSAVGMSATHKKLGFDHRNAVDVALHPDSPQGQALINYLQSAGIPFIAFRAAIRGSATGPHIHIGKPSHRISAA